MTEKGKAGVQPAVHRTWRPMPTAERGEGIYVAETEQNRLGATAAAHRWFITASTRRSSGPAGSRQPQPKR